MYQKTIAGSFMLEGISIHSGTWTRMTLHPSEPGSGITFRRTDVTPPQIIEAKVENVASTERCTELRNQEGYSVSMVEHVLSALRGLSVDNALIDVNGEEIPGLDGSSFPIALKLLEVGLLEQKAEKKYFRLREKVRVQAGTAFISVSPASMTTYTIGFKNDHGLSFLDDQTAYFNDNPNDYIESVSPARSFCYEKELVSLRSKGLIKGATENIGVIIGPNGPLSTLRFQDEFARHKLLDVIGDLALLPPFLARIEGERTSHQLNMRLARQILEHLYLI